MYFILGIIGILGSFLYYFRKDIVIGKLFSFQNFVFIFNSINLLVCGVGGAFLFPFMLIVSVGNGTRLLICLSVLLIGLNSLIALFKPKLSFLTIILYALVAVNLKIDDPKNNDTTVFTITPISSEYVGQTFETSKLFYYLKNLPENDCNNTICGYKYNVSLVEIRNPCANCNGLNRSPNPYRIDIVPLETKLKVLEVYEVKRKFSFNKPMIRFVLEDSNGQKSEMPDFYFNSYFIRQSSGSRDEREIAERVLKATNDLSQNGLLHRTVCDFMGDFNNDLYPKGYRSPYVEVNLMKFINHLQIGSEVAINDLHWITSINETGPKTCADIVFKTSNAYLLFDYFLLRSGTLFSHMFTREETLADCLPMNWSSYQGQCLKLEGSSQFDVNNWSQEKYKRGNENDYLVQ